jgi:light-regulated signal transduction histidine kinase (bacteriophytochrome)
VERKAFEQRLRDLNYELEQRVQERTVDLTRANDELEAFSYTVSHDLRAPLRAIAATSRVLIEDFQDQLPEEANRLLERQSKAAVRLGTLIDDLLKLARMSRARPTMVALDVSELARVTGLDLELGDSLAVAPGIRAAGDAALVRSVLANLIENAAKFRHPGRPLAIEVEGKYYGGEVEISVRDNGLGFSMAYESKIWEPFQRLVRDEEVPGTGIGLATVRRIVEAHGGRAWAEGKPGEGAAFLFTLTVVRLGI